MLDALSPAGLPVDPFEALREAADEWVADNYDADLARKIAEHVFPVVTERPTDWRARRRQEIAWVRSATVEIDGVKIRPTFAHRKQAFAGEGPNLVTVGVGYYRDHLYSRYRTEIVFARDCRELGLDENGMERNEDGTVNYWAPDALGRATLVLTNEPAPAE